MKRKKVKRGWRLGDDMMMICSEQLLSNIPVV